MDITKVLLSNYLPYAKGTIIGRAIPSIDGLKPAQRRILYTMYKMGLIKGNKTKSSNIVGQTMKLHPHGDMAIYETMVRMTVGHDALNCPYIDSKGNFGKVYSEDLAFAAPRYTEAKLTDICAELFENIDEDAVDFIANFDNTTTEPTLLPVKFPNILVNPSSGIAVGTSTDIPSFALSNVCDGTIGILNGTIKDYKELMKVLGTPEFTTGGYVHAGEAELNRLGEKGDGSFVVSGTVVTYPDKIEITEIPYGTKVEKIIEAIETGVKEGTLREVSNISDEVDINGLKLVVELKRGYNSREVLQKLCVLTPLRMKMSFRTRVIINDRLEDLGLFELLNKWIEFRMESLTRIYNYKLNKVTRQVHLLEAWEKIKLNIKDVARLIADKNETGAREELMKFYNLDEDQADYILDMRIRMFTQDNLNKKLNELANGRQEIKDLNNIINSDAEKRNIIINDLTTIKKKYGTKKKTGHAPMIEEQSKAKEEVKIDDTKVSLIMTKSGFIKRLVTLRDISNFELPDDEQEEKRWFIKNDSHVLVFTYSGEVHKILVDSIDASRSGLKDEVYKLCGLKSKDEIMFIDATEDYSGYFNLVYPNGRGTRVNYTRAEGKRNKYVGLYESCEKGKCWVTKADKFFMITARRKAAYCDLTLLGAIGNRTAFKVARVNSGDRIFGLQPVENVPNIDIIDLKKYSKGYTINIGDDELWHNPEKDTAKENVASESGNVEEGNAGNNAV